MKDKKNDILNLLKKNERLSTTKIAYLIKASNPRTIILLRELVMENKVKMNKEIMGFSWSLK